MSQPWTALFGINRDVLLEKNLTDVTQGQADLRPADDVNSITWNLSHILEYRHELLREVFKSAFRPDASKPRTLGQLGTARKLLGLPGVIKPPATVKA